MSKYDLLWEYIKINAPSELSFDEVRRICGFPIDHSYGMCFGIAIASALHWDIGLGLTVGILLGLIIGSVMEKKNIQKREEKQNERNI